MVREEIICIIPARKGSKGVPNKNILKIKNIPLIQYSIDTAKEISEISDICISTDSEKVKTHCRPRHYPRTVSHHSKRVEQQLVVLMNLRILEMVFRSPFMR